MLSEEIREIFWNSYFQEQLQATSSEKRTPVIFPQAFIIQNSSETFISTFRITQELEWTIHHQFLIYV